MFSVIWDLPKTRNHRKDMKNYLKSKQYLAFPGDAVVSANAEVIKTQYSLESYGNKLDDCYQKMLNQSIIDEITKFMKFKWGNDKNTFLETD